MKSVLLVTLTLFHLAIPVLAQRVYLPDPDSRPIQPALDAQILDPHVLNASDGLYYLTGRAIGDETRVPLWKSPDLKSWTALKPLLEGRGAITAAEIYEKNGSFYLLVTEREGQSLHHSEKPEGPYTFHTRLAEGIITASLFFDDDGSTHLVHGGGWITPLSADLKKTTGPSMFLHPSFDLPRPQEVGWATEKAQMLRAGTHAARIIKTHSRYFLLASERITRLNTTPDDILVASAESLHGPYTARSLAFMHAGGGSLFQDKDEQWKIIFSARADDPHVLVTQKPVITAVRFYDEHRKIGYTGEFYFEKEPIGNLRNRFPSVTMRDPSICGGPDGWHYLVHTENWKDTEFGKPRILLRRSRDLKTWEDVNHLVRTQDLGTQFDGKPLGFKEGERVMMWAPEIQYIHSKKTFLLSVSIPRIPDGGNMQTWIFRGDKPEGPFKNISTGAMHPGIDGFFFEEKDGSVYYLHGANSIVRMKDDLTGFDGEPREFAGLHGIEGMSLIKIDGKYLLTCADNTGGPGTASYECIYGVSDNLLGPYRYRGSVPHCGHTTLFRGHDGHWRMTMFGSDSHAPIHHGLGILRFTLDEHDRIVVSSDDD
jgi:xylan 1,4-beta-xylosidase